MCPSRLRLTKAQPRLSLGKPILEEGKEKKEREILGSFEGIGDKRFSKYDD